MHSLNAENANGYAPLLNDNCEETVLLDRLKKQEITPHEQDSNSTLQTANQFDHIPQSYHKDTTTVQFTLQMMVTASMLLQGTWFIQVRTDVTELNQIILTYLHP